MHNSIAELDSLTRKDVPSLREYLLTSEWDGVPRLEAHLNLSKDDVLAAEVSLPLVEPCDVSKLRVARMRRPYSRDAELILVEVSRLPSP